MQAITLTSDDLQLQGVLNDTSSAKDFFKRLPLTITCRRDQTDYFCPVPKGVFEPEELQTGWKNGDLLLWDGCFVLTTGGDEHADASGITMVIGHTDDYSKLLEYKETIKLTIRAKKE